MATPRDSLLPGNATSRETAHAETDGRFDDIDMDVIRRAKDPATAPAGMLGHLAWEWSADIWDPAWPVDIKRRVVAASSEVHRLKGTRRAVQVALGSLLMDSTLTEWWQMQPQAAPYTFRVDFSFGAGLPAGQQWSDLSQSWLTMVYRAVVAAKPVSRSFFLGVHVPTDVSPIYAGAIVATRMVVRPTVDPITRLVSRGPIFTAAAISVRLRISPTI